MTQAIVDASGNFLGGVPDGAPLPANAPSGAALVPICPDDAREKWNGASWSAAPPPPTPQQVAQALLADQSATAVVLRGLIQLLATRFGITPAAVVTAIVNAAN